MTARGPDVTAAGLDLLPHAQAMKAAAQALSPAAAGHAAHTSGTIRITAAASWRIISCPPCWPIFRAQEPQIDIELVPSGTSENLLFREADIALRMYCPPCRSG